MKHFRWALALLVTAAPAFAQDLEDFETRIGAVFSEGNLALRDLQDANSPVQQLKRFFAQAKMPLTGAQERQLNSIIEAQGKALKSNPQTDQAKIRAVNEEYTGKFYAVLSADQRLTLRRYRTDQIMLRGGFGQLRQILGNSKRPLTPAQEEQARALYDQLNEEVKGMPTDNSGAPDRLQLDKAENDTLAKVLKLLTAEQRQVLVDSRQSSVNRVPR
jgi:hypothetical protein